MQTSWINLDAEEQTETYIYTVCICLFVFCWSIVYTNRRKSICCVVYTNTQEHKRWFSSESVNFTVSMLACVLRCYTVWRSIYASWAASFEIRFLTTIKCFFFKLKCIFIKWWIGRKRDFTVGMTLNWYNRN